MSADDMIRSSTGLTSVFASDVRRKQHLWARSPLGYRSDCRPPWFGLLSWLPPRRARSPDRLGDQLLELAVEHGGNFRDACVPELAEERGRPVVLDAGLP